MGKNTFKLVVTHNGEKVDVHCDDTTSFEEICLRIGTMVMSAGITEVVVYRDEHVWRRCKVEARHE